MLYFFFDKNGKFLDYAGGYGIFVRLMRDIGFDFYWYDKYTPNLFARGFKYTPEVGKIEAITTFESFEHFVNPIGELENMLQISKNIIFTTELLPNPIPKAEEWWYYGLDHGQHISFFSDKTFRYIAKQYNLNYINLGVLKALTEKSLPKFAKFIIKFNKFGLNKICQYKLKSKTWEDHIRVRYRQNG